jgi:NADPH-dependent glutamate synthase beta subunit-like oxidoreductase/NAD-dependent dihydropyrimidine dehydrogenase PreA subunit
MNFTAITSAGKKSVEIDQKTIAKINSKRCVNCGTCREICPTEAISEQQRIVCRLCPTCSEKPSLSMKDNEALSTKSACTTACPLGIMPQGYVNLTHHQQFEEAFQLIWKKNPLPSVCGHICHHPCEQACKRGMLVDDPIAIRGIKRFLSDHVDFVPKKYPAIFDEEIAIVGAGPAGLTAAHYLSLAGYRVTLFESQAAPGGMLTMGIPTFRLSRDTVAKDIQRLVDAGLTINCGVTIDRKMIDALKNDYDVVLVAAGAPQSKELHIDGWRKEGVITALQFTRSVENGQLIASHPGQNFKIKDGKVVVIGGGNVALDCARTAVRMGASSVICTCLESGEDVPCHAWERQEAEDEGVQLLEGWAPVAYRGAHNALTGVQYEKVVNFQKKDGRISFDQDAGQAMALDADCVIVAIGQSSDELWRNYYEDPAVYFAGDVKDPVNSVVDAMASGKAAALAIDSDLQSRPVKDTLLLRQLHLAPVEEKVYPATRSRQARPQSPMADSQTRIKNFDEVENTYSQADILKETNRCLQCGYEAVNPELCIGCGACQRECPKGDVITMVSL